MNLLRLFESLLESDKLAVICFGRMNPPTIGHLKLVNTVKRLADYHGGTPLVFLSHSVDKNNEFKNPLSYDKKIEYAKIAFGDCVKKSNAKTIIQVLHDLYIDGYSRIIYVGGEDRIGGDDDMSSIIEKYNGFETSNEKNYYYFDSIEFVSAGHRNSDSSNLEEKASASYARQLVKEDDFNTFKKVVPFDEDIAYELFEELKDILEGEY